MKLWAASLVLLLLASTARADDTHYQNFITGGRAVTLGGAFTAISDDPSGMIFNPAGMADDAHTDISLSANLYGFERNERGGSAASPIPPVTNLANVATDLVIIPQTSGTVRTFEKDPHGEGYLNAFAFGVFVPTFRQSSEVLAAGTEREYRRQSTDRLFMPGIGYARKLGRWRIGVSGFYVLRALDSSETSSVVRYSDNGQDAFRLVDSSVGLSSGNIQFVFGVKYLLGDRFLLGASISTPGIPINTKADVRFRRGISDPTVPDGSRFTSITKTVRSGWRPTPTARVGLAYKQLRFLTVSADMSFHFPLSYRLVEIDPTTQRELIPFANDVKRNAVVNINAGVEVMPFENFSIGGGVYTDFSSSPSLAGPRFAGAIAAPLLESIDLYGLSATVGFTSQFSITRIGVNYAFGKGYDVVAEDNVARLFDGGTTFRRTSLFTSFFYIFVSSTLRFL